MRYPFHQILFGIIAILMSACYAGIGILLIIYPRNQILSLPPFVSYIIGAILLAYGIFRGSRVYKQWRE